MDNLVLNTVYPPHLLDKDYKTKVLSLYKDKYERNSITGSYIITVDNIVEIISTMLDKANNIIIRSLCNCNIFKPIIGNQLVCKIDMIHINGIFVSKYDIRILIPSSDSYTYNNNTFTYKDKLYNKGDEICIELINIRFEKYIYTCIAKLV